MDFLENTKKKAIAAVLPVFLGASGCAYMPEAAYSTEQEKACHRMASDGQFRSLVTNTALGAGVGAAVGGAARGIDWKQGALGGAAAAGIGTMIQQNSQYSQAFNACMQNTPQWTQEYNQYQRQQGGGTYPEQPQTVLPPVKPVTPNTDGSRRYQGPIIPGVR